MPFKSGFRYGANFPRNAANGIGNVSRKIANKAGEKVSAAAGRVGESTVGRAAIKTAKVGAYAGSAPLWLGSAAVGASYGLGKGAYNKARGILDYSSINMFILISFILHYGLKLSLGYNKAITWQIDAVFALVVLFVFFNRNNRSADIWRSVIIVTILEIFLPTIFGWSETLATNKYMRLYLLNPLLTPWWFYYAVVVSGGQTRLSVWARRLVIFFWIGVLLTIPAVGFSNLKSTYVGPEQWQAATELGQKSYDFYKSAVSKTWKGLTSIDDAWRRQMDIATGGYYTGRVDENQNEPLGVYIEDVKPSDTEFYRDEKASIWASLKVKTLDDGIKVNINCYRGSKDSNGNFNEDEQKCNDVYPDPKEMGWIYDLEHEDIDCSFDAGRLNEGSNKITVQAKFNFETMAYLKTYFMDKDRIRSMLSQGLDPLGEYGIKDKKPVAIYTNGPVKMGMGFSEPPIGISDSYSVKPRLGVTVESNFGWEGQIGQIRELVLQIPKSMSLDLETCNHVFKNISDNDYSRCISGYKHFRSKQFVDCRKQAGLDNDDFDDNGGFKSGVGDSEQTEFDDCLKKECKKENDGYNTYYLDTNFDSQGLKNIDKFKTFSCRVNLDSPQEILGNVPVSTKYMRAKARYDYVIEKTTHVNVKRDMVGAETGNKAPSSSATSKQRMNYIFVEYYDIITKWVDKYKEDAGKVPRPADYTAKHGEEYYLTPCLIMAQIAVESFGDRNAVGTVGEKGLMQIRNDATVNTAEEIRGEIGLSSVPNLFIPDNNIRFGTHYLTKQIKVFKAISSDAQNMGLAAYNAGAKTIKDACCSTGSCTKTWSSCAVSSNLPEKTKSITPGYITKIQSYRELCEQMQFDTIGKIKQEVNPDNKDMGSGSIRLTEFTDANTGAGKGGVLLGDNDGKFEGTKLILLVNEIKKFDEYLVNLYFGEKMNKAIGNLKLTSLSAEDKKNNKEPQWVRDEKFPFIRFKLTADSIEYEYMKNSVKNIGKLEDNKATNEGVPIRYPIWEDWVYAWYETGYDVRLSKYYTPGIYTDDKIKLYSSLTGRDTPFCTVDWPRYAAYARCEEIPGIIIRDKGTKKEQFMKDSPSSIITRGYAIVQIEYDPNYSAPCCTSNCICGTSADCATCGDLCKIERKDIKNEQYEFVCSPKKT